MILKILFYKIKKKHIGTINYFKNDLNVKSAQELLKLLIREADKYKYKFNRFLVHKNDLETANLIIKQKIKNHLNWHSDEQEVFCLPTFRNEILRFFSKTNSKFSMPLPNYLLNILKRQKFVIVSNFKSIFFWYIYLFKRFFIGIREGYFVIKSYSKNKNKNNDFTFFDLNIDEFLNKKYEKLYLENINFYRVLSSKIENISENIIFKSNKYSNNLAYRAKNFKIEGKNFFISRNELPIIDSISTIFVFIIYFIKTTCLVFLDLILGKFSSPILFEDYIKKKVFDLTKNDKCKYYFRCYEGDFTIPMWLKSDKKLSVNNILFFHSTNSDGFCFKEKEKLLDQSNLKAIENWTCHTWDSQQKSLLAEKNIVQISGPMMKNFTYNFNYKLPAGKKIAVFDIVPKRKSWNTYFGYSIFSMIYIEKFLMEVISICRENNIYIVHKAKHNKRFVDHKKYWYLINKFKEEKFFCSVDDYPVYNIINDCNGTICFPYSSTSVISKNLDKPTIFFDPSSKLIHDDFGAHNTKILSNKVELENWVRKIKQEV